jgi:alpha-tubulin suppressor-like RCC1 family protein
MTAAIGRVRWFGAVAAIAALATACVPPAPPAPAPLIECDRVAGGITYTPPATNSGEDITIDTDPAAELSGCVDHTGAGITSGRLELSVLLPGYLCRALDVGEVVGAGAGSIRWSDGSTSAVTAEVFGGAAGPFITELTMTGDRWPGARGSVATFVTSADGNCTPDRPVTRAFLSSDDPIAFVAPVAPLLPPRTDLAAVDTGSGGTTCALMSNRSVNCWGDNSDGQLGNVLLGPGSRALLPVPVTGIADAVGVSVGVGHACATLGSGHVRCWGNNSNGQLGNGSTFDSHVPVEVPGLTGVLQVAAGQRRTCARLADATVRCWGEAAAPDGADSATPVPVGGLAGVTDLTAGSWHNCALLSDRTVRCWGGNQFGQLGDGTTVDSLVPVPLTGFLPRFVAVTAGDEHTCALDPSGEAWCWGFNRFGQLGQGSPGETPLTTPSRVLGTLRATALDAGGANTCALVVGGSVSCWGNNSNGELGTGTTTSSARPTLVLGLRGATALSAGGAACAMLPGGRADCWGDNSSGQLGLGTTDDSSVPAPVIDP